MHLLFVLFDFTIVIALLGTTMLHHFATAPFFVLKTDFPADRDRVWGPCPTKNLR